MSLRLPPLPALLLLSATVMGVGAPPPACAELPSIQLRQRTIRADGERLLRELEKAQGDEAVAAVLLQWVQEGTAIVVSDLSATVKGGDGFETRRGRIYKWATENDQEYERPILTATSWEDVFLGASLKGNDSGDLNRRYYTTEDRPSISMNLCLETRAQMPEKVRWALFWPENEKPEVGWYEQDDFLRQAVITQALMRPGRAAIVSVLPPPATLEEGPAQVGVLDVVLAEPAASQSPEVAAPKDAPKGATGTRVMLHGFGVDEAAAVELLGARDPGNDAALLARLQAMVHEKRAVRRLACGVQSVSGDRATVSSARDHSYPTEMPTIPSAWDMRPVGLIAELELVDRALTLSVDHHPSRFRWGEWVCALDAPALIMRQPQFFVQHVETTFEFPGSNAVLVSTMHTPECLKGSDKGPVIGETFLLFAQLVQAPGSKPIVSQPQDPPDQQVDLEAIVFDLPATEAMEWAGSESNDPVDDEPRYRKALAKVKDGTASMVCHLTTAARTRFLSKVHIVEEVKSVTEYNPADFNPTGRYRPTAFETIPVGSQWEVDVNPLQAGASPDSPPIIVMNHTLLHDVLPAVQPTLKESMEYTQKHEYQLPRPVFTTDKWHGTVVSYSGKARCLGPVNAGGRADQGRVQVAFVRGVARK